MKQSIFQLIKSRQSIRTYSKDPINSTVLDKIQNYLLDLLKTRESETRNELAKKSLAELHFLLDYAKENSDSKYDSITLNYVISNYFNLEYVSLRNNREGEENEI